jgi:hypothetical protein
MQALCVCPSVTSSFEGKEEYRTWLIDTKGETEVLEEKPVTMPFHPPQIPQRVTCAQTWVAGVRDLLLNTGATLET